jgi:hypothetical protein
MAYGTYILINFCSSGGCKFFLGDISLHKVFSAIKLIVPDNKNTQPTQG